jgi:hypothetical protein
MIWRAYSDNGDTTVSENDSIRNDRGTSDDDGSDGNDDGDGSNDPFSNETFD